MEPLGLNQDLAHQAETTLPSMLCSVLVRRLLDSGGRRKNVQLAVSEDAVHVEEKQFDFLGASLGGLCFGHRRDSSIAHVGTAAVGCPGERRGCLVRLACTRIGRLEFDLLSMISKKSLHERVFTFATAVK